MGQDLYHRDLSRYVSGCTVPQLNKVKIDPAFILRLIG